MATNNSWNNAITAANSPLILNSGTNAISISTDASATTVNIGTGGAVKTVTVGSTNSTSALALRNGTNNFSMHSASYSIMSAQNTGEITYSRQPCFLAFQAGVTSAGITGEGTVYTVPFGTTVFDQDSNFSSSTTFTAPVTGRYLFNFEIWLTGLTALTTFLSSVFVTSNASYTSFSLNPRAIETSVDIVFSMEIMADMDVSDTAIVTVKVSGAATKVVKIVNSGDAGFRTPSFSGKLIC